MSKLSLNFQRPYAPANWLPYTLLSLGMLAMAISYFYLNKQAAELVEIDAQLEQLTNKDNPKKPNRDKGEQQTLDQHALLLKNIRAALDAPWPKLFQALEQSKSEKVELLEIVPDPLTKKVRLLGQAAELQDVLQYVEGLKKEGGLNNPELLDHQVIKQDDHTVVHFEIEARWITP